jgi:hypothetical protein
MAFTSFHGPDFSFELIPADKGPLPVVMAAWHHKAVAAGRVPCVYLTASWCPPSVLLEKSLADPRMQQVFRDVDAATFDIDVWGSQLTDAGFVAHSVPIFFVIDADGKPVGPTITGAAWGENTVANMAPPLERFFDVARAARPAPPAPAPPAAQSKLLGVLMLVAAVVLLVGGAYLKVYSDSKERAEDAAREARERIQKSVQDSIQSSLRDQAANK